jgi:ABC-type transport system involved in multi-copper enzyme maturation permease subunit
VIRALAAEFSKLKRARMILWTALVVIGYTSIGLAMFPVIEDLQAQSLTAAPGSTAAGMAEAFAAGGITGINWESAMVFVPMGVSGAWGVLLLSLIAAYVFGRELREGTDISSATLPIRRETFVFAKMVVIAVWAIGLAILAVVGQVGVDLIHIGAEGLRFSYVWRGFVDTLYAMLPLYLTLPVIAWLSLSRKGYLRPMLFATVMFMLASGLIGLDAAAYFPWSMPIAAVGVTWMPVRGELTVVSWLIALAVFAVGMFAVLRRVNRAGDVA